MSRTAATYVYCLVVAPRRPRLTKVPAGLPGTGPVRLLELAPQRYLVVADAPLLRYGEGAIRRGLGDLTWVSRAAMAHEAVVEVFIGAAAVLPMKLFTLFASDERALAQLRADRRRIDALVARLADHLEWGVRLMLDPVSPDVGSEAAPARGPETKTRRPGIAYLTEKRAQREAARERAHHARSLAADLYTRLADRSRSARRRPPGELPAAQGALLLDAAFLVPRRGSRAFSALLRREQRQLARRGCHLTVTGPWPPYSFMQQ